MRRNRSSLWQASAVLAFVGITAIWWFWGKSDPAPQSELETNAMTLIPDAETIPEEASTPAGSGKVPETTDVAAWEVWKSAFFKLATSEEPTTAAREVSTTLSDARPEVRRVATEGAALLPPAQGIPLLVRALQDSDDEVRALARDYVNYQLDGDMILAYATALSQASDAIAREILAELNFDPDRLKLEGLLSHPDLIGSRNDTIVSDQIAAWLGNPEGVSLGTLSEIRTYWDAHETAYGPDLSPVID